MAKKIDAVALLDIVLTQPIDNRAAYIPHRDGDEVKEVFAFVADLFERTVVLELADVDPLRELFSFFRSSAWWVSSSWIFCFGVWYLPLALHVPSWFWAGVILLCCL
jgi:hypothetical protein